jgi:hypothetical protein
MGHLRRLNVDTDWPVIRSSMTDTVGCVARLVLVPGISTRGDGSWVHMNQDLIDRLLKGAK